MAKKYYVVMTDKFLSGWGLAEGKTNKLVIVCDTHKEASTIERNASKRDEMKNVYIVRKMPSERSDTLLSVKKYSELGNLWKQ